MLPPPPVRREPVTYVRHTAEHNRFQLYNSGMEELEPGTLDVLEGDGYPGSLVCHCDDECSRGVIVSERSTGIGVMWSVEPHITDLSIIKARLKKVMNDYIRNVNDDAMMKNLMWRFQSELDVFQAHRRIHGFTVDLNLQKRQFLVNIQPVASIQYMTMTIDIR